MPYLSQETAPEDRPAGAELAQSLDASALPAGVAELAAVGITCDNSKPGVDGLFVNGNPGQCLHVLPSPVELVEACMREKEEAGFEQAFAKVGL